MLVFFLKFRLSSVCMYELAPIVIIPPILLVGTSSSWAHQVLLWSLTTTYSCMCIIYVSFKKRLKWLFIYINSSSYGSIPLTSVLLGRNSVLSTLCQSCGFNYRQQLLKVFPGPGCFHSKDGVVWLWHLLANLYINI